MTLNVLHIAKYYHPYSGGMETIIKDLSEGISEKGHNVRVVCSNETNNHSYETINGVEVFKYPLWVKIASQTINPSLLFSLNKHANWADIVHIHSPNPLCELMTLFFRKKVKVVSTHHSDIYRQKLLKVFYRPFWNIFIYKLKRIIVPTENHIIYSDMIKDSSDKSAIIPFGIKQENYKNFKEPSEIREKYKRYILFVGRLVEYKGLKYLLKAVENLDVNLVIIGDGPLKEELTQTIKNNITLSDKVFLLGRVNDQDQVNSFYKNAFCFVLPSVTKNENFGVVQLEAMLYSLPIITTTIKSGVPLVGIPNKTTLLVPPRDSHSLSQSIKKLLDDVPMATRMGQAGFKLYNEKYTFETMISNHEKLYLDLCGEE